MNWLVHAHTGGLLPHSEHVGICYGEGAVGNDYLVIE